MGSHSQDDYWMGSSQRGFDFDTADDKKASLKNDELSYTQLSSLKYSGLDDVAESGSSKHSLSFPDSSWRSSHHALKFTKKSDPLLIFQQEVMKVERCTPEKTIRNMILGLEYSLEGYKSKKEKLALLDAAEKTHDGNTIIEVVLFLRNALKKTLFQKEIVSFPDALNVYLAYLEENHETDELVHMLLLDAKIEDAAFAKYEAAIEVKDPERKLQKIKNCLSTEFQWVSYDSLSRLSVEEHYRILKSQIEFLKNDFGGYIGKAEMKNYEMLTGQSTVTDSSVICSLIYSCLFFYKSQETSHIFTSPQKLMAHYNLTKKQFTWAALRALASLQKWSDIDDLFMSKNWLGNFKVCPVISFPRVLEILSKAKAPTLVLSKYVSHIENEEEKLELAQKYACHSVAFEVFKNNKDRLGLIKYKDALEPHSPDLIAVIEILNNPAIRWKN